MDIHVDGAIAAAWLLDIVDSNENGSPLPSGGQRLSIEVISIPLRMAMGLN